MSFSKLTAPALLLPALASAALYNTTVHTQYGDIVGYPAFTNATEQNLTNWRDITIFKGIPFAADTSGQNRWRAPQPRQPWNGTLYADTFGDVCPSSGSALSSSSTSGFGGGASGDVSGAANQTSSRFAKRQASSTSQSEDCLNLNIWTPAKSSDERLPVVMWSYPKGGSNQDALFYGGGMADAGVVFVNYNYRANSLGWMAHPELSAERFAETGTNSSGSYAMLDQFMALKWIHENIDAFGGDPNRITVQGQSAGSAATYHIVNSPLTEGLIVGAIIESGVRDPHDPLDATIAENYITLDTSLEQGIRFLDELNVTSIDAARNMSYDTFLTQEAFGDSTSDWDWTATLDYYAMPATYLETLKKGAANKVPIITGNTRDESGATYGLNITLETYLEDLNSTFNGTYPQRYFEQYPANNSWEASAAYNAIWTTRSKIGTYLWSQAYLESAPHQSVWNYLWNHAPPGQTEGAYHESEINYVLNNLYGTDSPWTEEDYAIGRYMNGYWVNFIKHQNPNGKMPNSKEDLPEWPRMSNNHMVHYVGNLSEYAQGPIATKGQIELVKEWFQTQPSF